jgi:tetratricopeptide (TPR) repeat protein
MPSRIHLPPVPERYTADRVAAWSEPMTIDSYLPIEPSPYPAFLDARVYQGSSGRVFPLPFHERISQEKTPHEWQAVHLENEWIRLVILPELGGRIHVGYDKTSDYDFFYRNNVIKPALVGLAGPWLSGGVEFNWPQHHRPGTFLPTDFEIEREPDGAITVWCSDHDPFTRMKGMHGIRLRPDSAVIEARVRLYNRTDDTQTFLWWANVAAAVGDDYQSFFPTDVHYVADHAKRALATFPRVEGTYYGVDYPAQVTPERPEGDRLDWYRNIPVPTSYMVVATQDNFFGGYDHGREAGFVHWADRGIAPGKKQWTWGNSEFGWAWDRNLTDDDGPYVELMAGAFTDNQPDFSYLAPGETKTFSQFWYPIQKIGTVQQATRDAALHCEVVGTRLSIGVAVTRAFDDVTVVVETSDGRVVFEAQTAIVPGGPFLAEEDVLGAVSDSDIRVSISAGGVELLRWEGRDATAAAPPRTATEPPEPASISSVDELFFTGQYLAQYRHATRAPEPYWLEALRRDPGDVRSNLAVGASLERAHRFVEAESHLRAAIDRLLERVPNPADGEPLYRLGINLVHQQRDAEAAELLVKATWSAAWRVPAHYALGRLHARRGDLAASAASLLDVLRLDAEHLQATALLGRVLREQGRETQATELLRDQSRRDRLDQWTRDLLGEPLTTDAPTLLDVALEYAGTGFVTDALRLLDRAIEASGATPLGQVQVHALALYHRARLLLGLGSLDEAADAWALAATVNARHTLPSRLADVDALLVALSENPLDARAASLLGSWHYDKRNYDAAIEAWTQAAAGTIDAETASVVHRNLGIAEYNVKRNHGSALRHFELARASAPSDAKLLYETDQLLLRTGASAPERRALLEAHSALVTTRDDLTITYVNLLTEAGEPELGEPIFRERLFQPWEGGEGEVLGAWENLKAAQCRAALDAGDGASARAHIREAIAPPQSLGEARHPLANAAELFWLLGESERVAGDHVAARDAWETASSFVGDFVGMSTQRFSAKTYWSIRALERLGRHDDARELADGLIRYADDLEATPARIDFFATSLPAMLLFHDDPDTARLATLATIRGQLASLALIT